MKPPFCKGDGNNPLGSHWVVCHSGGKPWVTVGKYTETEINNWELVEVIGEIVQDIII